MDRIKQMENFINGDRYDNIFFPMYPFTTENINGYLDCFDLKNKSLLTVGSSCDQTINASLAGCEDITIYDKCPLVRYYYYLKVASLLSLNREEFLNFLCKNIQVLNLDHNPYLLSKLLNDKVSDTLKRLDYESYYVWDYLFNTYTSSELLKLFRNDITLCDSIIHCNRYLKNDKNYNKTKKVIMNSMVNFIEGDVTDMKLGRNFKNIWLSNVIDYLDERDIKIMFDNARGMLDENGKILLSYFYYDMPADGYIIKLMPSFHDLDFYRVTINGTSKNDNNNSIFVYKKK